MATAPRAVFFDLFGTLVAPFRRREHTAALRACAEVLGIGFTECERAWGETYTLRVRGEFPTIADGLDHVVRQVSGRRLARSVLQAAEDTYLEFSIDSLRPVDGAAETLEWLCGREIPLALVSNCAPDVPCVWERTAFAQYFRHTVFSCEAMLVKPDRASTVLLPSALVSNRWTCSTWVTEATRNSPGPLPAACGPFLLWPTCRTPTTTSDPTSTGGLARVCTR